MKIIGIVGGMGAGKSTVVSLMNKVQPISSISADVIGHEILLKGHEAYEQVVACFGTDILDETGEIIRRRLGERAFQSPEGIERLNEITHPLIIGCVKNRIKACQAATPSRHIVLEAALLLESGLVDLTDVVVAVYADPEIRLQRVIQREGLATQQILKRFEAQKEWKELKAAADYVIDNSVSLADTEEQIKKIMAIL